MKKSFLGISLSLFAVLSIFSIPAQSVLRAQTVSIDVSQVRQLVQIFIAVGIIPSDKAAAAEAALNSFSSGNTVVTTTDTATSSSSLLLSVDPSSPLSTTIAAIDGSNNNEADSVNVLVFDARSQEGIVQINTISGISTLSAVGHAAPTTAYLYSGPTEIGSAAISYSSTTGSFTFNNLNYFIPASTTVAFSIREDIKNADATPITMTSSIVSIDAVDSNNSVMTVSGSATGNPITVINAAPIFTLIGTPTINQSQTPSQNNNSASTLTATFTINILAAGGDFIFPTQSSGSTFNFGVYANGTEVSLNVASSTSWSAPNSGVITNGLLSGQAFELQQNNSVEIPVTFIFQGNMYSGVSIPSAAYAIGLNSINYMTGSGNLETASYMYGNTGWETPTISLTSSGQNSGGNNNQSSSPTISYVQGSDQTQNTIHSGEQTKIYGNDLPVNPIVHVGSQYVSGQTNSDGSQITFVTPTLTDGSYSVYVTSTSISGQTNSVNVTSSAPSTFSHSIISPNGGENFQNGDTITYSWLENVAFPTPSVQVSLINYSTNLVEYISFVSGTVGQNSRTFSTGGLNLTDGQYIIKLCYGGSLCDSSTAPFNIIPNTSGSGSGSSGGGSSSGNSSTTPSSPETITLSPNQDYYFHTSGSVTLGDIKNAGGITESANFSYVDAVLFMPGANIPAPTDSAVAVYHLYNGQVGEGWLQTGQSISSFVPDTQQVSAYFIIRKGANSTAGTFTTPSNVIYDGVTAQNGQPRPWNQ